jgi:hypothetical protein
MLNGEKAGHLSRRRDLLPSAWHLEEECASSN